MEFELCGRWNVNRVQIIKVNCSNILNWKNYPIFVLPIIQILPLHNSHFPWFELSLFIICTFDNSNLALFRKVILNRWFTNPQLWKVIKFYGDFQKAIPELLNHWDDLATILFFSLQAIMRIGILIGRSASSSESEF